MGATRVQIRKDGSVTLPREALEALGAGPGSYLSMTLKEGRIELEKVAYDPWVEGQKRRKAESFDEIMKRQQEGLEEAEKDFLERLKKPPEVKPEDRHDFWD